MSGRRLGAHITAYFRQKQSGEYISGAYPIYSSHTDVQARLELVPSIKPPEMYIIFSMSHFALQIHSYSSILPDSIDIKRRSVPGPALMQYIHKLSGKRE